jgi:CDGSH-type Zn-finger protein
VSAKGPYRRTEKPGTRAICACGRSTVLPYCDGSHMGSGVEPLMITFHAEEAVEWCTCGKSKSFPRCDGSHDKG